MAEVGGSSNAYTYATCDAEAAVGLCARAVLPTWCVWTGGFGIRPVPTDLRRKRGRHQRADGQVHW